MSNKSGRKSKLKMGKEKLFGSSASLQNANKSSDIQIPEELSLEEVVLKNGSKVTYLRVYCEKIRPGDHFKTLKVYETTTAAHCVKELMETYGSRVGSSDEVGLYEVIGRIDTISPHDSTSDPLLRFSEVRCRFIEPQETINSIFSGIRAGAGLSRRVELRRVNYPHNSYPAAAYPGIRASTPVYSPRLSSVASNNTTPEQRCSSVQSQISNGDMPMIRRSMTSAMSKLNLRDSRRKLGLRIPNGPHLTLIRGLQSKYDVPLWDLTPIIQKNRRKSEMTIGTRADASIRTYEPPDDHFFPSSVPVIYAKLVGYDYPVSQVGSIEYTGAIFIEPYINERTNGHLAEFPPVPSIYVNQDLINPGPELSFEKRLLRPGDFIYFGSPKEGYVFLFKDPRWIPDHRLELGIPLSNQTVNPGPNGIVNRSYNTTVRNANENGNVRTTLPSDRSSDTGSSFSRPRTTLTADETLSDHLPRLANLRQVLKALLPQIHTNHTNRYGSTDPLETPRWSRIEPWRSSGLFAHLARTAASFAVQLDTNIPNRDVDERDPKIIQEYSTNYVKDLRSLLIEFYDSPGVKSADLIIPQLWFGLFCYNVAVYLSPGWLTTSSGPGRCTTRTDRLRLLPWDGRDSAASSSNSNSDNQNSIESLHAVAEFQESAYHLATKSIDAVVHMALEEILPYLKEFLNGPNSSPVLGNTFFPNSINFTELRYRLGKLAGCFQVAFFPSGMGEGENGGSSSASSPFCSNSIDSTNMVPDNLPEQYSWHSNASRARMRSSKNPGENGNYNFSPESESENEEHATRYGRSESRQSNRTTVMTSSSGRGSIDTANRIEAVVWRQILAAVSHHLLSTLVAEDSIPIDWETGERLLRGINWLSDWLQSQQLDLHRRPLNMISDFANLLATPREQLLKMSWTGMRSMYPAIPPSLLKFMLDEYEVDEKIKQRPIWRVDQHDANEAEEDTVDVLNRVLNTWRSKESLLYSKTHYQASPIYRPRDLWDLFTLPTTGDAVRRLDQQLEAQRVDFRWASLIRYNPGARAIPCIPEVDHESLGRPQSRQRQTNGRRSRAANLKQRPGGTSPYPRRDLTRSNPNLLYRSEENPNMHTNRFRKEHEIIISRINGTDGLSEPLKPAPSKGEPIRIIRSYNNEKPERKVSTPQQPPTDPREAALYHLEGLAASLPHVNFSQILAEYQLPKTAMGDRPSVANRNPPESNYSLYESQPNLNFMHPNIVRTNGYPEDNSAYSPAMTEYPRMTPLNKGLQQSNRVAQSLWHLPTEESRRPTPTPREIDYGRQVVTASQNWEDFRMAAFRRGFECVRGSNPGSTANSPRHPMHSLVSASLGNLHSAMNQAGSVRNPKIIVEEISHASSGSLTDSFLDRDDDLGDVMTRSTQGNMVHNVTLVRSPESGFGLVLVDGERTQLDQPGVFIKQVSPNTPAAENGELGMGDRILAINGKDLSGLTYKESLATLKNSGTKATFTVRQCNLTDPTLLLKMKTG